MRNISGMGLLGAAAVLSLIATASFAADPQVQAAIKTITATAQDPAKVKTFCEMTEAMDKAGDKEDSATDAKIDGYMKQLGSEFETAWNAGETIDENSSDGKALSDAIDQLANKCSG